MFPRLTLNIKANFDPGNLPPCIPVNVKNATHKTRVVLAAICKSIEKSNLPLAKAFKAWLLREVGNGPNAKQRIKELQVAFKSRTIAADKFLCTKRSNGNSAFVCPYNGNAVRCAFKRGVQTNPAQTVGSLIVASAVRCPKLV